MTTIWKIKLDVPETVTILPAGAKILTVQVQHGFPCIWAVVDTDAQRVAQRFRAYGTGEEIESDPGAYIGTVQAIGGLLVWHVFEAPIA